jgi:hypothetical protein
MRAVPLNPFAAVSSATGEIRLEGLSLSTLPADFNASFSADVGRALGITPSLVVVQSYRGRLDSVIARVTPIITPPPPCSYAR